MTDELQAVISRCRDDIVSPYLIHRRPDRKKQKQAQTKDHWTQVEERYLTRAFKEAREVAGCYKGWKEEEMPGFHEVRALSLHLYQKAGKDGQKIAGHASETMTKNYQRDHAEVIWSEAIPDLNISEITGQFCTSFARFLRRHKKADLTDRLKCLILLRNNGRDGVIRTLDP